MVSLNISQAAFRMNIDIATHKYHSKEIHQKYEIIAQINVENDK